MVLPYVPHPGFTGVGPSPPLSAKNIQSALAQLPNPIGPNYTALVRDLYDWVERDGRLPSGAGLHIERHSDGVKPVFRTPDGRSYAAAQPALLTMGGKKYFQQHLAHLLPMGPLPIFVDATVGGGSVTLAAMKGRVARSYWINDLNPSVVAFYRVCADQRLNKALRERLHLGLSALEPLAGDQNALVDHFMALWRSRASDDLEMAERYFVLNRLSFRGHIGRPSKKLRPFTRGVVDRLARLTALRDAKITNLDVTELLAKVPQGAFVFVDPPYLTNPGFYSDGHQRFDAQFDHAKLASELQGLAARGIMFMVTYDKPVLHDPVLKPILAVFRSELCKIEYQSGRDGVEGAVEVAIMNYRSPLSVKPDLQADQAA